MFDNDVIKSLFVDPFPNNNKLSFFSSHYFQEIENTFDSSINKLDKLHQAEARLTNAISPDDMAVLHERIVLLAKQWDELHLQTCLRRKRIADKLNEWSYFGQKYKEMSDWLTEMEVKVSQNGEHSIEDLLQKLRKVSIIIFSELPKKIRSR